MAPGGATALILCSLLCLIHGQEDTRTREEVARACHQKVEKVKKNMERWVEAGRHPVEIRDTMHQECFPLMRQGRFREAEKVIDRVLEQLTTGAPSPANRCRLCVSGLQRACSRPVSRQPC